MGELEDLKRIVKVVKVGRMSVEGVGIMAKAGFQKARPFLEQGARNFARNFASNSQGFENPFGQPRRVKVKKRVKLKKVKKKKKKR